MNKQQQTGNGNTKGAGRRSVLLPVVATVLGLGLSQVAFADHDRQGDDYYAWARVVESRPIISYEEVTTPEEHCRIVHRRGRHDDHRDVVYRDSRDDFGPRLIGSVIGGVIGHQLGGGKGKTAFTIAGALAGAEIASAGQRDAYARNERARPRGPERECYTTYQTERVQYIEGYDVTYEYLGRQFHKVTDEDPGDRIQVRVSVSPVDGDRRNTLAIR